MLNNLVCCLYNKFFGFNLYFWNDIKNSGDDFNTTLLDYFNIKYKKTIARKATLVGMGSILNSVIVPKSLYVSQKIKPYYSKVNVIGCGFIKDNKESEEEIAIKDINVLALRGKLSLKRLENIKRVTIDKWLVLADPGILASCIFKFENTEKKFDVGIIPHYIDKDSQALSNIKLNK